MSRIKQGFVGATGTTKKEHRLCINRSCPRKNECGDFTDNVEGKHSKFVMHIPNKDGSCTYFKEIE